MAPRLIAVERRVGNTRRIHLRNQKTASIALHRSISVGCYCYPRPKEFSRNHEDHSCGIRISILFPFYPRPWQKQVRCSPKASQLRVVTCPTHPRRAHKPNICSSPQQRIAPPRLSESLPYSTYTSQYYHTSLTHINTANMGRQFFVGGNFKMYVTTQAVSTA